MLHLLLILFYDALPQTGIFHHLGITSTYQRVAKSQVSFVHLRVMLRADGERMHPRLRFSYL